MFVNSAALVLSILDMLHFFCIFRDCCGALHCPCPCFAFHMILISAKVTKEGKNQGTSLVWLRGPPPPARALCHFGLKMPILGRKQCFLGSGGQFDAPPSYFAGARLKKTCVAGLGSRKMGDSGPPPLKKWPFLLQNGLKMPILGEKKWFLGSGGQFDAPPSFFAGAQLKKTCVAGLGPWTMGDSGPPPLKNRHFLPKNGLKMPILGQKQCLLGSGGQFDAPPPYFAGARLKKTCVAGLGSR